MRAAVGLAGLLLFLSAAGRAGASEADAVLGSDRGKTFDSYVAAIRDAACSPRVRLKRMGTDWDRELAKSRRRFVEARTASDAYYALRSLQNSVHDIHGYMAIPDDLRPTAEAVSLPFSLRPEWNGGRLEYAVAHSSTPLVQPGWVLESLDGKTPAQLADDWIEWFEGASPDLRTLFMAESLTVRDPQKLPPPPTAAARATFRDPARKKVVSVNLDWSPWRGPDDPISGRGWCDCADDYAGYRPDFYGLNFIAYKTGRPDTALVRLFSFHYRFTPQELWDRAARLGYKMEPVDEGMSAGAFGYQLMLADFAALASYARRSGAKRLVIDVRENSGGAMPLELLQRVAEKSFVEATRRLAYTPYLRADPSRISTEVEQGDDEIYQDAKAYLAAHPRAEASPHYPYSWSGRLKEWSDIVAPAPRDQRAGLPVVLVTGPGCISACDSFAAVAKDDGLARLVGMPTDGDGGGFRQRVDLSLADGRKIPLEVSVSVDVRPDGGDEEAAPTRPDVALYPSRANRGRYLEAVLDAAAGSKP